MYVLKLRGAAQGIKSLVAEVIAGELARALGLSVPDLKLVELDPDIGKNEPDEELRELLMRSAGLNVGVDFLPARSPSTPRPAPRPRRRSRRTSCGSTRS